MPNVHHERRDQSLMTQEKTKNRIRLASLVFIISLHSSVFANNSQAHLAEYEIDQLIQETQDSNCQFYRNGVWYNAEKAVAHIRRKYDYLLKRDLVSSSEEFIERAATQSSWSGKAYKIQCGQEDEVSSAAWLNKKLKLIREKRNQ